MEQNTKHTAEMQNATGIEAAIIELGGERPAYAHDLVTLCKEALEQGVQLDGAIAALSEMAVGRQIVKELHQQLCDQVTELFRAAMRHAIDQRPYFNFKHAIEANQMFSVDTAEHFALQIGTCHYSMHDEFVVTGMVVGGELDPIPCKDMQINFTASFSSDCIYDSYQAWTKDDFENCFEGVYLDGLKGGVKSVEILCSIKAWLDRYVTTARLLCD